VAEILILTGPPAAGKSTVAQTLAARYDRVAHIPVDQIRHLVTPTGYARPGRDSYLPQRRLAIRNASCMATNFYRERFGVIIDDVLDEEEFLELYLQNLREASAPVHLIKLIPTLNACEARHRTRSSEHAPVDWLKNDYEAFMLNVRTLPGVSIDTTSLTAEQTADRLQELTTHGQSLVYTP
jgi:predicted kinase